MASSLSNSVNNLAEGIHKINVNMYKTNVKCVELNTKIVSTILNTHIKDNLIVCKCLCYNRNYQKKFNENLKVIC